MTICRIPLPPSSALRKVVLRRWDVMKFFSVSYTWDTMGNQSGTPRETGRDGTGAVAFQKTYVFPFHEN